MTHIYSFLLFQCIVPYALFLSLSSFSFIFSSFPGNLENFYSSLKLMRVLHNSHLGTKNQSQVCVTLLRRDWGFLSPLQHKLAACGQERQQSWAHTHLLGKWHVNFTVISSALPISTPHGVYFKYTPNAIERLPEYPDFCCSPSLGQTGRVPHLAGK